MNEDPMTPLNDDELTALLRQWVAPATPPGLHARIFRRRAWWHWLLTGSFRVPVPVAAALLLLIAVWAYRQVPPEAPPVPRAPEPVVSLADFRPVERVEALIVGDVR
jgi:hypothetical protein